ncbi:MAG: archease [Terriglobia bacterium]
MEPFRILDHTADVGFEALGKTLPEVFANAARALTDLFVDIDSIEPRQEVLIEASGWDLGALLVNFLSEILFLEDAEGWLFRAFEVRLDNGPTLRAKARGERFDRSRHQPKTLVKAITYHQLLLEQVSGGWRAQVYVDI